MGSKSARLKRRRELKARRVRTARKTEAMMTEETRRARLADSNKVHDAVKTITLGDETSAVTALATGGANEDSALVVSSAKSKEDRRTLRSIKRRLKASHQTRQLEEIHKQAEILRKINGANGTGKKTVEDKKTTARKKDKSRVNVVYKVIAVLAAVATLGSVAVAGLYSAL